MSIKGDTTVPVVPLWKRWKWLILALLVGSLVLMALLILGVAALFTPTATAAGHLFPDCVNGPLASNTVCNTNASVADRAKALVAEFNTTEKYALLINTSPGVPRLGLPSYQWWREFPPGCFLGRREKLIPDIEEALHCLASSPGVTFSKSGNYSHATSFPAPILMSAAFDDALIEAVAVVTSTEARAFNNVNQSGLDYWTPNINPYRDVSSPDAGPVKEGLS